MGVKVFRLGNLIGVFAVTFCFAGILSAEVQPPPLIRSAGDGPWSAASTWEGGKAPAAGARVQIRSGNIVTYDVDSDVPIRSIHVAGTLNFAPDKNTRLLVGLIKVQAGDDASETGFECAAHAPVAANASRPALLVGTQDKPIEAGHTATISLVYFEGMDKESLPAIVCCGGQMEFHGAAMNKTFIKLAAPAKKGDASITLAEAPVGWRVGDRIIVVATERQNKIKRTFKESTRDATQTEERIINAIDGSTIKLDKPIAFEHTCSSPYRADVANLSRNVVIESADPRTARGHTMFHRNSAGSISYAEFRHLGKEGVLGRYSIHLHLCGDTMRGASIVGASIWDSGNRWITVHGTNYLVVRDCVGYQSKGHGFFFEDGTEVYNVMDHNLAVQAYTTKPLPEQIFPFDKNDGAGFWWANSLNTFTGNVAAECDEYGYFFQALPTPGLDLSMPVRQPDGSFKKTDIRTLPFVRFDDNEAYCQRRHSLNLGGSAPFGEGVAGIGPDVQHPFILRNTRLWNDHWAFHPVSPSVLVENMDIYNSEYALWRGVYKNHNYRNVKMDLIGVNKEFSPQGKRSDENVYPQPLEPVDDLPPASVITSVTSAGGNLIIHGTASDNGAIKRVSVNGIEAQAVASNFSQWQVILPEPTTKNVTLTAGAEDATGNVEKTPHVLIWHK